MIIYDKDYANCSQKQRDKFLDKLFDFLYELSETWSYEDETLMEYEFHDILSELLYHYLCFINAGAEDDVKKVDKFDFNRSFSMFANSFLDDEFKIDVDPDAHICDYSTDGVCSICGDIKYHSRAWFDIYGGEYSDTDYPY